MKIKKISAVFMVVLIILSCVQPSFAYTAGEREYSLKPEDVINQYGAAVTEKGLEISSGGSVEYDFFLPFVSDGIRIDYKAESSASLEIDINGESHKIDLLDNSTQQKVALSPAMGYGDKILGVRAKGNVSISKITFFKKNLFDPVDYEPILPKYSDEEELLQTSFVADTASSICILKNARRYINVYKPEETPLLTEGKTYLPIELAAKIMQCYHEKNFAGKYAFLRTDDETEYYQDNGSLYKQVRNKPPVKLNEEFLFANEEVYVPIRFIAEEAGYTVRWKDGIIIIDKSRNRADDIYKNDELTENLKKEFSNYRPQENTGKVYYVSCDYTASDENDGSEEHPFRTLKKAGEAAHAGDRVIIREGIYREILAPENSGTPTAPIIFQAAEGEEVIISATDPIGELVPYRDNILTGTLDWDLGEGKNQLFLDGKSLTPARHPNTNTSPRDYPYHLNLDTVWPVQGNILIDMSDAYIANSDTDLNQDEKDYWKDAAFVSFHGYAWCTGIANVTGSEKGKLYLGETTKMWWFDRNKMYRDTDFAFLINHVNCIDMPGEYVVKGNRVWVYPPEGYDSSKSRFEAKRRNIVFDIADRDYIQIRGIKTIGGGAKMNNSKMCALLDMDMNYVCHYTYTADQRDGFIEDADVSNLEGAPLRGEVGIYIGGRDNTVSNCHIAYSSASALYVTGNYINIENNYITDCNYLGTDLGAIFVNTSPEDWRNSPDSAANVRGGHVIYNNTICRTGRSAISMTAYTNFLHNAKKILPMAPMDIAFNELYDGNIIARDSGLFYTWSFTLGSDFNKTRVHHNMVYDSWCNDGFNTGIYFDDRSNMAEAYDNIVFSSSKELAEISKSYAIVEQIDGYVERWNNNFIPLLEGGRNAMRDEFYPGGRFFKVGSSLAGGIDTDKTALGQKELCLYAEDAVLSDGILLDGSGAAFTGEGQSILFKDTAIGGDKNTLRIYFTGQQFGKVGKASVTIKNEDISAEYDISLKTSYIFSEMPPYQGEEAYIDISLAGFEEGIYDIEIKSREVGDTAVLKILPYYDSEADDNITAEVMANQFTGFKPSETADFPWAMTANDQETFDLAYVNGTWDGAWYKYNVSTISESKGFYICAGSSGKWFGGKAYVRIGSPTAEPIASVDLDNEGWSNFNPVYAELTEPLAQGRYEIYITYSGEGKCSNVERFGFIKEILEEN